MFKIISTLIFNPKIELTEKMSFKTTKSIEKVLKQVCKDTELSADLLINNAILNYFAYEIEKDSQNRS